MKPIKISMYGADGFTCQMPRIMDAMKSLGHTITEESPDLIYSNDPTGYPKAMHLKKRFPNSYLMLNFLDVPWHLPNVNEQTKLLAKHFLSSSDAVTTISHKVKKDLSNFINKKIDVIYNPIKDVFFEKIIKKDNIFLYVGRANDPIKRINLLKEALLKLNNNEIKKIKICGPENPGFGNYLNIVSDKELNKLLNASKYLCLPSKAEGLGLTMIEALVCGSVPIVCSDNETAKEFLPSDFFCEPDSNSMIKKIDELNKNYEEKRKLALNYGEKYKVQFDKISIAKNILNVFNSK